MESKRPPYGSAPIQRKAQQEKAPSLGSFAKNMLIGGAIYMASSTALNIAGRGLIKYMAPQISKIAGSGFNLGKIASSMAKNSGGGIGASIAEKLGFTLTYEGQKVVAPSLGGLVTRGIHTRATSGKFGRGIADFLKVSKQTQTKNAGFSQFMKQTARYYKPKNVSSSALSRFVGGMAVKAGQVAGDLPMMYAIDRSFGNLYGLDQTHKPPISDVGATFKDFAKWSGTVGPGFMMFRSLGPLAKAAKYQTAKTLARPTIRDAFIRPGFQALSRVYRKGQAATHGFSTLINQMNQEFEEQLFKAPTKRKDLFNPVHHLKTFGVFAKKQAQKFKDLRQTDESKAGTVRRLYRTHMERWDRQIQEKSYASTADSYLNMYADVNGSQITKKSKVAVKMRKALDREVKLRNRKSSSMLGYVLGEVDDQGIHRFETAKVDPLERLRHLASSTAINDTQRTKYQKLYNAFDRRTGVFKERAARRTFQNQIELRNFTKVDNSLVNLNKGALGGLGKMLENIELPNPVRALSNVIGRPVGEVSFKPFHMLSAGALNKRNPVYSFRGYKGGKLPSINAAGLFAEKEIEKYGALVGGRPLQAIGNKLVYEPFAQRFRNINGQIYEKALRGVRAAMAEEQYDAKKNIHRQKVKMMSGASLAQTAEAVKEGDLGVLDLLRHDLPRHVRQTTEKVKYAFELGEYGSGHRSAPTSIVSRFKKFFNPRGYNAFERYGEAGRLMNTIANSSADDVERMLNNKIEAGAFVQNMLKIQSKAGRLINNAQDEMLFMVKASELEKGLHHKKFQNNDIVNIIRQRRGKSTNDFYDFLLNNVDDAIEHTNSTKQQNVLKTAKELAQSLRDGGNTSNIKLNWFGKSFDETDFLRRSALLTDHLKNIATKETNDVTSDIFQQMINSRSSNITSAYAFAQKIGGENPFKMRMDFSRMEQKYRDLKKVGVFVQNRGDKPDVARQFEQSFRKLFSPQQRGADGGDEFLGYFRRYGDSLSTANRSKGALKSLFKSEERFTEYDSVMQQINRQFFNPRQESFLLESIDYGKLSAEAQRNASKYQMKNVYGHYLMNRMNEVASVSGMAIDTRNKTTPGSIMQTWALKRAAPIMGLAIGWEIADQVTDIADVGPFDEGLNVFAAEKAIQFQDMTSRMRDAIGITSAAQKMEGIAPGFVTSPGASLLRTSGLAFGSALVGTIMGNPAAGAAIGLTAAGFQDFGLADLTKSHEENRDIWSGRKKVPIRSGARWSLSKAFYGGDRIKGWAPHWFTRMKTQAEYSPTLYGSKLEALIYKPWSMLGINPIGSLIDPYHYEKVHYDRRPYLYTSPAADEMPIVGAAMGATVGQLIKPTRTMHSQDVAAKRGAAVPAEFTKRNSELQAYARASLMAERTGKSYEDAPNVGTGVNLATPNGIQMTADRLIKEGFQQPMGLYGWAGKLASDKVFDKDTPFSPEEHIAGSGEMTSFRRQYWDQQLGDLLLVNEFVRRMIPERDAGYNPLANTMQFLPNEEEYYINFLEGDPYTKIPLAEYRLPGEGYEATNKVDITFPLGASAAGKDPADMMQVMAGIKSDDEELLETAEGGTKIHKLIQEAQMSQGLIKESEKFVYDPMTNMHGYVDMIGQYGEVIEIKTVGSAEELDQLDQPKYHHTAQVNVYMKATDTTNAKIIYAARDDPSQMKEFNVGFSHNIYNKTLENVARARNVASQIDRKLMSPGAGYSHLDRFKILADVAPLSKKYQSEKSVLETKAELGELTSEQYYKFYEAQKMAEAQMRPSDMFPNRFMDNLGGHRSTYGITAENIRAKAKADALMRGEGGQLDYDVISKGLDAEYNQYNINSNIKDAAEYNFAERALGAAWELGMKVQIPYVSRKFFQYWTPMEAYKRNVLQGSKDSYWNTPVQSFVEPEMQMMAATTSPIQGAVTGGFIGSFAGPIGGVLGMAAGSLYGTGRGMLEQANIIDPFVKEDVLKARTAERYIDDMKMISAQAEYQQTGNVAAQKMYNTTLMGSMAIGKPEYGYLKGLARKERAYVSSIVESGNEEMQQEIERYLPDTNRKAAQGVMSETGQSRYYDMQREEPTYDGPALDWNVVNDDHLMDKMKYQFIDDMGGNAYLSGLGWKNQMVGFKVSKGLSDMRNPALKNNQTLAFGEAALKDVIYGAIREVQSTAIVSVFPDSVDDIIIEVT